MKQREILVVDDEEVIRDLLDVHFSEQGYSVYCASSGEDALKILKEKTIEVIFLDLQLPGINGLEVCKKIRDDIPHACIFAITGFTSVFDLLKCRAVGFDDYFPKPFDVELLDKTIESAFERLDRWKRRK